MSNGEVAKIKKSDLLPLVSSAVNGLMPKDMMTPGGGLVSKLEEINTGIDINTLPLSPGVTWIKIAGMSTNIPIPQVGGCLQRIYIPNATKEYCTLHEYYYPITRTDVYRRVCTYDKNGIGTYTNWVKLP